MARRPKAIKLWINLEYPYSAYHSIDAALRDNPDTTKEDYHKFDSKMEYERYLYLLSCQSDGTIAALVPHPGPIEILKRVKLPKNALRKKTRYKQRRVYTPDFHYVYQGVTVYEDFKGFRSTAGASLQHSLLIAMLLDEGAKPEDFHFKVVRDITAYPGDE